eukprot:7970677-Lingulodinium_polyedra.AAC.1
MPVRESTTGFVLDTTVRNGPISTMTTYHPVVHSGLYRSPQWVRLQSTGGSLVGSTAGLIAHVSVESTLVSAVGSTVA